MRQERRRRILGRDSAATALPRALPSSRRTSRYSALVRRPVGVGEARSRSRRYQRSCPICSTVSPISGRFRRARAASSARRRDTSPRLQFDHRHPGHQRRESTDVAGVACHNRVAMYRRLSDQAGIDGVVGPAWPHSSPPCRATSSDNGSTAHPFRKRAMLTSRPPRHAWASTGVITTIGIRLARARLFNAQAFVSLRPAAIRTPASTNRAGIHQLGVHLGQNVLRDSAVLGLPLRNRLTRLPQEPLKLVSCQQSRITGPSKIWVRQRVLRHGHIHNDTCRPVPEPSVAVKSPSAQWQNPSGTLRTIWQLP
jgi:hypothetical protein